MEWDKWRRLKTLIWHDLLLWIHLLASLAISNIHNVWLVNLVAGESRSDVIGLTFLQRENTQISENTLSTLVSLYRCLHLISKLCDKHTISCTYCRDLGFERRSPFPALICWWVLSRLKQRRRWVQNPRHQDRRCGNRDGRSRWRYRFRLYGLYWSLRWTDTPSQTAASFITQRLNVVNARLHCMQTLLEISHTWLMTERFCGVTAHTWLNASLELVQVRPVPKCKLLEIIVAELFTGRMPFLLLTDSVKALKNDSSHTQQY